VSDDADRPTLRAVLEREHHEIDADIDRVLEDPTATDSLARAFTALRRHIYLEEEYLFPPLRAGGLMAPVLVMLREHGDLWAALDEIDELVATGASGPDLAPRLESLLDLLDQHNAKEEPIVYAAADQTLDADTVAEINQLVETSTLPDGWVCQQAPTP
jgi:regulator of cell morphogenesis and NO signaling